jgi:hypothetical protein
MFCFMEITHKLLHLEKETLVQLNIMDISESFIWNIHLFDEAFKCGHGVRVWGNVGTNTKPLCVEFCNFVQRHIFLSLLSLKRTVSLMRLPFCLSAPNNNFWTN